MRGVIVSIADLSCKVFESLGSLRRERAYVLSLYAELTIVDLANHQVDLGQIKEREVVHVALIVDDLDRAG